MDIVAFFSLFSFLWVSHWFYANNTTPAKLIRENVHAAKPIPCKDEMFHLTCDF